MTKICKTMAAEAKKDPREVFLILTSFVVLFCGFYLDTIIYVLAAFFILLLTGIEILEARLDKLIKIQMEEGKLLVAMKELKRHQLEVEGKLE